MLEQDADEVSVYFKNEISGLLHQLLEFLKEFKIEKSDKAHINLIITLPQASINGTHIKSIYAINIILRLLPPAESLLLAISAYLLKIFLNFFLHLRKTVINYCYTLLYLFNPQNYIQTENNTSRLVTSHFFGSGENIIKIRDAENFRVGLFKNAILWQLIDVIPVEKLKMIP